MKPNDPKPTDFDPTPFTQAGFGVRFGWGPGGLRSLASYVNTVVIVDVLSFSTTVDVAISRDVVVFPYRWHNGTEDDFAAEVDATVASRRGQPGLTLSPSSLLDAPAGTRLVLPSPNGSALTFGAREAGAARVIVGCLRNAQAIADAVRDDESVAVVAAGERWRGATGPLRPAIEDVLGAGAILAALKRDDLSPEAQLAAASFVSAESNIADLIAESGSGRELIGAGFEADVALAVEVNRSAAVPTLDVDGQRLI